MSVGWDLNVGRRAMVPLVCLLVACGGGTERPDGEGPPKNEEPSVAKVIVSPETLALAELDGAQLTATAFDAAGESVEGGEARWESADESIATVDETGFVTAHKAGETTISVQLAGQSGTAPVTVTAGVVDSVRIGDGKPVDVDVGESVVLTAVALDAKGRELPGRQIAWSTALDSELTVSATGKVESAVPGAWAKGEVTARVGEVSGTVSVSVRLRFEAISTSGTNTCGLDALGRIWCWGLTSDVGENADGKPIAVSAYVPTRQMKTKTFVEVAVGSAFLCGLDEVGRAFCAGEKVGKVV